MSGGRTRSPALLAAVILTYAAVAGVSDARAQEGRTAENIDRTALRVCSDANNMPFSNDENAGFENKIAEVIADELKVPVTYTWWPDTLGRARSTLGMYKCDVIMGVTSVNEQVQATNHYYESTFALVYRSDAEVKPTSIEDPALKKLSIGVIAQTPPATAMAALGLLPNMRAYSLVTDTRYHNPARDLMRDVAAGRVDVGMIWGPIGGYWATHEDVLVTVVPIVEEPFGIRMHFRIAMGVRETDQEWKRRLNTIIRKRQDEIDRILGDYGVPLLDRRGRLKPTERRAEAVPEPDGYRMAEYRAPVPATLRGAGVIGSIDALDRLIAEARPVLIDVLPTPRRPVGRPAGAVWRDPPHDTIPGGVWLPNVGYGALPADTETYFRGRLAALTGGDKAKPVVFYCKAGCWMSWNAGKRAIDLGYTAVRWYPEGIDGWRKAGRGLTRVEPLAERERTAARAG